MLDIKPAIGRTFRFVPAALVLALAVALAGCDSAESTKSSTGGVKAVAQPIAVDNIAQSLEQMKGKVVVLDLWATWCGPCRVEIPSFIKLQEKYKSQGLEVVGVALDPITGRGTNADTVAAFMQQNNINYTIWIINNASAFGKYQTGQGIPTTYVIDRNGRTVKTYVGLQPEAIFESDIKSLL
ncbi:MAG TPA: redoxin domain-containing protein [Blastocatellia bacterium]|nr:redoxin domain-containing protein [Blastocatellia bacterium]